MRKRLFDVLVTSIALLFLCPWMMLIALWVKLDSPGPALFRQERVGRGGVVFRIHKFRTMRPNAALSPELQITVGNDPRITRSGRFLRRTKLDELPQLLDVLWGHMSLVGPRPEVPRYVALYPAALREKVLSVRPGITDPASIAFSNEADILAQAADPERAYVEHVLPQKLQQAVQYVEDMSFGNDLRVLITTLRKLWWSFPN